MREPTSTSLETALMAKPLPENALGSTLFGFEYQGRPVGDIRWNNETSDMATGGNFILAMQRFSLCQIGNNET
jgi:hypothetical protein